MPKKKDNPNKKPQRERFIEVAREIGADESAEAFEKAFKTVIAASLLPLKDGKKPS